MALTAVSGGLSFPTSFNHPATASAITLDAAGEMFAMIGRIYWNGRPAGAKTISAAGGGAIAWRTGTTTFIETTVPSTIKIGIQDVATATGPIARPDEVFDVSRTLTSGVETISSNAWNSFAMTGGTGTKSMTHGDEIAVVFEMTARNGGDSVIINCQNPPLITATSGAQRPTTNTKLAGAWQTTNTSAAARWPQVVLTADDGTLGTIYPTLPHSITSAEAFSSTTNPDERGLVFQVPWDCTIDALWAFASIADANSDYTLKLYSDPLGTPTQLASVAVLAEKCGVLNTREFVSEIITPVNLTKDTNYGITLLATGTTNSGLHTTTLGDASHRAFYSGGTTVAKITRNDSAGAFTAESPAITLYRMGVMISHLHNSGGSPGVIGS